MNRIVMLSTFIICVLAISGCFHDEDDNSSGVSSRIVGLWDVSDDYGSDGFDEIYFHISQDGKITLYDYLGDSFDNISNCYSKAVTGQLTSLGNNRYLDKDIESGEEEEITLTAGKIGNTILLTVNYVDADDDDNDGNTTEILSDSYPRPSDITINDMEAALCATNSNKPRLKPGALR